MRADATLPTILQFFCICSVVPVLLLTPIGYGIHDAETWVGFALAFVVAGVLAVLPFRNLVLYSLIVFTILFSLDVGLYTVPSFVPICFVLAATICFRFPLGRQSLLNALTAFTFVFGILSLSMVSHSRVIIDQPSLPHDQSAPAVIHILLDELGESSHWPDKPLAEKFETVFKEHGFQIFRNVRSTANMTADSVPDFLNPQAKAPTGSEYLREGFQHRVKRNALFERESSRRVIDVVESSYIDLLPKDFDLKSVGRAEVVRSHLGETRFVTELTVEDRARIACGKINAHLQRRSVRNYKERLLQRSIFGRRIEEIIFSECPDENFTLSALNAIEKFTARIGSLDRGTYVFTHFLLPHAPYILDAECKFKPVSEWMPAIVAAKQEGAESQNLRYRRYQEQCLCLGERMRSLFLALQANPKLRDAIILVHGDHGTRIRFADREIPGSYSKGSMDADNLNTFFAVRDPSGNFSFDLNRSYTLPEVIDEVRSIWAKP